MVPRNAKSLGLRANSLRPSAKEQVSGQVVDILAAVEASKAILGNGDFLQPGREAANLLSEALREGLSHLTRLL